MSSGYDDSRMQSIYEQPYPEEEWICHDCKHLENQRGISDFFVCKKGCKGEIPEVTECREFQKL